MSLKLATNIIEIPVSSIEQPGNITSSEARKTPTRKFSIDLDGFLNNDFADIVAQNVDAPVKPAFPSSATAIRRQESNDSVSSNSSFFSVDFDDYQQGLLDDFGDDLLSPFGISFPQSPSIEDLSRNFTALGKTPDEEVQQNFQRSQKNEKVENNEDSSASSESGSESDSSGSVSDPATIKKELDMEEQDLVEEDQEGVHDEPDVKEEEDEEYRPAKRRILGIGKNDSFSSVSSYSSGGSESDEADEDEYEEDEDEGYKGAAYEPNSKRYKQPLSLRADDLKIGEWSLKEFAHEVSDDGLALDVNFDIKILFGRRKIKYEIIKPSGLKNKATLVMDFCFSSIIGLDFKTKEQKIVFQLSEPPVFSKKEKGKCGKIDDFTNGYASKYPRHYIYVQSLANYSEYMERLLSCDRRLRQLAKVGINGSETPFPENVRSSVAPTCDWDKESKATKYCETCKSSYCDLCDEVIHRQASHKAHKRNPVVVPTKPLPPKPKRPAIKKRKKVNSDRCRCGTGATKGTLGEPCTGNRCPCFSNGKSCVSCGCKNCANPIRKSRPGSGSRLSSQEALRV